MVFKIKWVSHNFSQILRVLQSHFLNGSVRLAVSIFLQSRFGISISQSKNSIRLVLAEKHASLAVSQSLELPFTTPASSPCVMVNLNNILF